MEIDVSEIIGVKHLLETQGDGVKKSMSMALNQSARDVVSKAKQDIMGEIKFKKSYLDANIAISKKASQEDLSVEITARDRPTSLNRFMLGQGSDLAISIKPGEAPKKTKKLFKVKFKNGGVGVAYRLKPDEQFYGRELGSAGPSMEDGKVMLLYGPSVEQAFEVAIEGKEQNILDRVANNFFRQMERLR